MPIYVKISKSCTLCLPDVRLGGHRPPYLGSCSRLLPRLARNVSMPNENCIRRQFLPTMRGCRSAAQLRLQSNVHWRIEKVEQRIPDINTHIHATGKMLPSEDGRMCLDIDDYVKPMSVYTIQRYNYKYPITQSTRANRICNK